MVIAGAYGCGNTGDDAILAGLLKKYPSEKWDITAFSADPEQTERYFCVKTVKQKLNVGFSLGLLREFEFVKMIKAIKDADILLIGGGALIHDLRIYNLPYFFLLHALARVFCKKVIYFGIGVGPLSTRFGKWLCRHMFPKANHVSVRDQEGKIWLEKAGVKTEIFVSADPAFSLSDEDVDPVEVQNVFLEENIPNSFIGTTVCGLFKSEDFWKRHHVDLTRPLYRMI